MAISILNLSELDGSQGFVIEGITNEENAGYSVSNAGDVNGDGIDDLIIGAPGGYYYSGGYGYYGYGYYGYYVPGRAYIVFGGSDVGTTGSLELSKLDGSNGFVINAINDDDELGISVSNAGDINGDGIDDIIIGASDANSSGNYSREGASYVVFGSNDGFAANLDLADLDGNNGFVIGGLDDYDNFGRSVSNAGDVNGDGIDDLIIGAPYAGNSSGDYYYYDGNKGESYIVFGRNDGFAANLDLATLDGNNGFVIGGLDDYDNLGRSVSSAGDVNGDGIDDLIIGAPYADSKGNYSDEGQSYVVFGSSAGFAASLELSELNGSNGFVISGIDDFDNLGRSVSGAGDINGDGIDDLIIGVPNADSSSNYSNEGDAYVIFGSGDGFAANLDLANPEDIDGLLITGIDNYDNLGRSVSGAGDVNGDGVDDLIIGAPYADSSSNFDSAGVSYVIFGVLPLELIGDDNNNVLTGGNGDDFLSGLGGNDVLQGIGGRDQILGGSGDDLITGGEDDDTVKGQGGNDNILGNEGNDNLIGNSGSDDILGGEGDDTINGGNQSDRLVGEAGDDRILGGAGGDLIFGNDGNDFLSGNAGSDLVNGGAGNDSLKGGSGNDTLEGNSGDDLILGNQGADEITGNDGNDSLEGKAGDDTLIGGSGNDSLSGDSDNDLLIGIDYGELKSDFGAGELDTLTGGAGSDIFVLADEEQIFYDDGNNFTVGDTDLALITDFDSSQDTIQLQGSADLYSLDFFTSITETINAKLIYDPGISAVGETIAILENVDSSLIVDDSAFTFV